MKSLHVHIIHVGNMSNKGTQALLKSDVAAIREILGDNVHLSVSTTDTEGVKKLDLVLDSVLPPVIDIPYEKADSYARGSGYERGSLHYRFFALAAVIFMPFQAALSVFSTIIMKAGMHGVYRSRVLQSMKNCDLVISYSNENFKEGSSYLPFNIYWILAWWSILVSRTFEIFVAKFYNKPVVMFPNSLGPFRTHIGRLLARLAFNSCDLILVREPVSCKIMKSTFNRAYKRTRLTFDTTWLFESTKNSQIARDSGHYVAVCPGFYSHIFSEGEADRHTASFAKALDEAIERLRFSVIFLPHYVSGFRYDDLEISKSILQKMEKKEKATIVRVECVDDFKAILNEMDMVISSKMHPAVLALAANVATLCIAYDHKQTGLFESLELTECVIPLQGFSEDKLFLKILYVWNNRGTIASLLKTRGPTVRRDIRRALRFVLQKVG